MNGTEKNPMPQTGIILALAAMAGAVAQSFSLDRIFAQETRALLALSHSHYKPYGRQGGSLAHRQWKRRRAAGWDR